jgi:hypothetical protein
VKKLFVTVMYTAEIEVDDRVSAADLDWAAYRRDDTRDGRQNFSTELASFGVGKVFESFVYDLKSGLASRICQKYPGAARGWYEVERRIPDFKIRHRIEESLVWVEESSSSLGGRPGAPRACPTCSSSRRGGTT